MSIRWHSQSAADIADGLILFDGVCVLCSGWVRFVIERDKAERFRFVPIQSPYGTALATRFGISSDNPETNAVVLGGRAWFKSDAAIAVLSSLPHLGWVRLLRPVPRLLRDWVYDLIARNRYRWFGRTDSCLMPTPELMRRFPDADRPIAGS
jgi:predicted DCC family thiol-disulfide oxidoreductase YuxK